MPAVTSALGMLSPRQQALLNQWLPGASVARDHSWRLVETTFLEMTRAGSRFIVKAGGADDHHIERAALRPALTDFTRLAAQDVGNEPFEAQGHRMIAEALAEFSA
jgi:hypothetical protein